MMSSLTFSRATAFLKHPFTSSYSKVFKPRLITTSELNRRIATATFGSASQTVPNPFITLSKEATYFPHHLTLRQAEEEFLHRSTPISSAVIRKIVSHKMTEPGYRASKGFVRFFGVSATVAKTRFHIERREVPNRAGTPAGLSSLRLEGELSSQVYGANAEGMLLFTGSGQRDETIEQALTQTGHLPSYSLQATLLQSKPFVLDRVYQAAYAAIYQAEQRRVNQLLSVSLGHSLVAPLIEISFDDFVITPRLLPYYHVENGDSSHRALPSFYFMPCRNRSSDPSSTPKEGDSNGPYNRK